MRGASKVGGVAGRFCAIVVRFVFNSRFSTTAALPKHAGLSNARFISIAAQFINVKAT
jgi:hypothetical protein